MEKMENVASKWVIVLMVIIGLQACNTQQITVSRRQYRPGFYVSTGKSGERPVQHENPAAVLVENSELSAASEKPSGNLPDLIRDTDSLNPAPVLEKRVVTRQFERKFGTAVKSVVKSSFKEVIKSTVIKQNTASVSADNQQAGLIKNLVWFIIVILLLAYIIALLAGGFGLGLAVHLLLIAAIVILMIKLLTPV